LEVYVNIKRRGRHVLLAICDADLLGKTLTDGDITFTIRKEFYSGLKVGADEAVNLINQSTIVNMVGEKIVSRAIERGFVHPQAVLTVSGVPHAQIVKM
jgi:hypothetical protein